MIKLGCAFAAMLALACGSPQRPKSAARCSQAAANVREVFRVSMETRGQPVGGELQSHVESVVTDRCVADRWSVEATSCLVAAKDEAGIDACAKTTLTAEQNDAVDDAIEAGLPQKTMAAPDAAMEGGTGGGGSRSIDDPCGGDADGAADDPCGGDADQ